MKNIIISILSITCLNSLGQNSLKATYNFNEKIISVNEEGKLLDYGFTTSILTLKMKNEKIISYSTPIKEQKNIKPFKDANGNTVNFDNLNTDSVQNLYFVDTLQKIKIIRRTVFYNLNTEVLGNGNKQKSLTNKNTFNLKATINPKYNFSFKVLKEQKTINGLVCNKGTIIDDKGKIAFNIWIALKVKCYATFYGITNCPGLIVEANNVNNGNSYILINFELNPTINDSEFEPNEFKEPMQEGKYKD